MAVPKLSRDGTTMTVRVPMSFTARGGRKLVVSPDGSDWKQPRHRIDNTMVKALARAFRWQRLLESGQYATIEEITKAEKINTSYISRILRLTLLSPPRLTLRVFLAFSFQNIARLILDSHALCYHDLHP